MAFDPFLWCIVGGPFNLLYTMVVPDSFFCLGFEDERFDKMNTHYCEKAPTYKLQTSFTQIESAFLDILLEDFCRHFPLP
jgi:hypothetical protein